MSSLLENLKRYFETTPREEVLKDWEKSKDYDSVGITVSDLLRSWGYKFTTQKNRNNVNLSNVYYPKKHSGFFV